MALACGLDPIEVRIRNEPSAHPERGLPFLSRNLGDCLREDARRFGWQPRDPAPRARRDRRWPVGTGVAASSYPSPELPGSVATIRAEPGGRYTVLIAAADIGARNDADLSHFARHSRMAIVAAGRRGSRNAGRELRRSIWPGLLG